MTGLVTLLATLILLAAPLMPVLMALGDSVAREARDLELRHHAAECGELWR